MRQKLMELFFVGAGVLGLAMTSLAAGDYKISESGRLYSSGGKPVAVDDLSPAARQALYEASRQYFESVERIVENNLLEEHIVSLSKKSGKSLMEVETELFSAKVSEKEAKDWYESNKARLNGRDFDSIKNEINHYLSRQKMEDIKNDVLEKIKKERKFSMALKAPEVPTVEIDSRGFPEKGGKNAKVTIVEFADYKCPHCREASASLKKITDKFGDKVRLVYLDFPLRDEGVSMKVALGAVCADAQGKFWDYHYKAFEDQPGLNNDSPEKLAEQLKLNLGDFKKCMTDKKTMDKVAKSKEEGQRIGVQGTPAIYLNGRKHAGYSEESLEAEIKKLL